MNNFETKSDTKILTLSCKFLIFRIKTLKNDLLGVEAIFFILVANVLQYDNIRSKKKQSLTSEKNEVVF